MEYVDILKNIPATIRKEVPFSPYKPGRWKGFQRSLIRTRSGCQPPIKKAVDGHDDNDDASPSPAPSSHIAVRGTSIARQHSPIASSQ